MDREQILSLIPIADQMYKLVKGLDQASFLTVLGILIDSRAGAGGITSEDTFKLLGELAHLQIRMHGTFGTVIVGEETRSDLK